MAIIVNIPKPETFQIEIWGKKFDVLMGESFIMDGWLELSLRAEEFKKNKFGGRVTERVKALLTDCHKFLDAVLGDGAAFEIFGRNPVGIAQMVTVINAIVTAATKGYAEKLNSYE